jgi:acetylglutamate kinase
MRGVDVKTTPRTRRRRTAPIRTARRSRAAVTRSVSADIVLLKLGGELLEPQHLKAVARAVARAATRARLVVVHGGGREIDAALAQASIPKRQVDGLRITDEATLDVVVAVLAGSINTRFVAAINAAGGKAVGLTGADWGVVPVKAAPPHRATNGELVDLGLVGEPLNANGSPVITALTSVGFVPVVACVGGSSDGRLFNVNADTMAGNVAARLGAVRLVIAGGTAGVLDGAGATVPALDVRGIEALVRSGTATAGMIAKLRACRRALDSGVDDIVIADGREPARLLPLLTGTAPRRGAWTRVSHASD